MDSVLSYLIKQGENYLKEYTSFVKDKLIPKQVDESQAKKAGFLFFRFKKYLDDRNIKVIEGTQSPDLAYIRTNDSNLIVLNRNNSIIEKLKELINNYMHYKLDMSSSDLQKDLANAKDLKARSADYLVYKRFNIEGIYPEDDYVEEDDERFCEEVDKLAQEVIKDIEASLHRYSLNTELERGDVVETSEFFTDEEEETYSLMFILEKQGDYYKSFKITSDDEPYITSVRFEKDNNNNLNKNSSIQMGTTYLINKSEIINKIGHAGTESLNSINKYAKLFESKNLTKPFINNSLNSAHKVNNTMSISNELKWRESK